eukprot:m.71706 g.71706  ORF g.71706 m.71706 type:complete len:394 (-) comp20187_c0_seq1:36-1217(-)
MIAVGDIIITGGATKSLKLWRLQQPELTSALECGSLVLQDTLKMDGAVTACSFDAVAAMGVVSTTAGTVWYVTWPDRSCVRLVSSHSAQITQVVVSSSCKYLLSSGEDGTARIWSLETKEQIMQFQVGALHQKATCADFSPDDSHCAAGYSDGVVRIFDLAKVDLESRLDPHSASVTSILYFSEGVIISGSINGSIVVSSATTGMSLRAITDHTAALTSFDKSTLTEETFASTSLWLAVSEDRRVSVWRADWARDMCDIVDWLTFAAPEFVPDESAKHMPPTLARFSPKNRDIIIYTSFSSRKEILFHSMGLQRVVKRIALNHWALSLAVSSSLLAVGTESRLLKLVDVDQGTFQDFIGHSTSVSALCFDRRGQYLFSVGREDILCWKTQLPV